MKIAYIITSLANAGPINVVLDLVKVMMSHSHYCKVYYFDKDKGNEFPCDIQQISFGSNFDFDSYDIVHTHGVRPDLFIFLKKPLKIKTLFFSTIHSFIFEDHVFKYGKLKAFFTTRITLACTFRHNKVIVLSKTAEEYYKRWIPNSKLTYAYNTRAVFFNMQVPEDDKETIASFRYSNPRIIGTVCGVSQRKGLDQIVRALPSLPDIGFIVIGDGPALDSLRILANDLGVADRILFMGERVYAYRYLPYFDVFVFPSYSEGFPLAMLEAAAYGKCIVSTDIPVFKEIFTDSEVLKFHTNDINSVIEMLKLSFKRKEQYQINVKKKYDSAYSPECFYRRHMLIYQGKS